MTQVIGRTNVRGVLLIACLTASLGCLFTTGCWRREILPTAFDPADARFMISDFSPRSAYADQPVQVSTRLQCRSLKDSRQRMYMPTGTYTHELRATPADGEPQTFTWTRGVTADQPTTSISWRGNLRDIPDGPGKLPVGEYDAALTVTLPDGAKLPYPYERRFSVRPRELILSLQADKATYLPGDTIVLTGSVTNAWGKPLQFSEAKPPRIALASLHGHDTMLIDSTDLPKVLAAGATHKLFDLRFVAGRADKRFSMGYRREDFPLPFGLMGKYAMQLTLRGEITGPPISEDAKPVSVVAFALPAKTELEIVKDDKAAAGDPPAPEYKAVITQNIRGAASIAASHTGRTTVLDVIDPGGIGRAEVTLTKGAWPERLVVRLRYEGTNRFRDVEGFTIGTDRLSLHGSLRSPVTEVITTGGKRSNAAKGEGMTFTTYGDCQEVVIPAERHFKGGETLKIQWVDQYRG